MLRINSMDADAYGRIRVTAALDLLVLMTEDMLSVMQHMSPNIRREVWQRNNTIQILSQKFLRLHDNLNQLSPQ